MSNSSFGGFLLVLIAGVMNGSFALPMRWTRDWAWENTWLAWSFIALIVFPLLLTSATIPHAVDLYRHSEPAILFWVGASGAAWGVSQVLFGLGLKRVGMALGFAIVVGLAAAAGSLIPLLSLGGEASARTSGWLIAGILVVLAGVSLCSYGGSLKNGAQPASRLSSWIGIIFCVGAGLGGSMINIGMVAGAPLARMAALHHARSPQETNSIWLPMLSAGFVTTMIYCGGLLTRNRNWGRFIAPGSLFHWGLALAMAACWFGSVEVYGIAASRLGRWGPALGWPIFLSSSIATANSWGFATGEWRGVRGRPLHYMLGGICVLIVAMFVIASATHISAH